MQNKSYFDYGTFTPIQVASVLALESEPSIVQKICDTYQNRRDTLVNGLNSIGWENDLPKATMYLWAEFLKALVQRFIDFAERLLSDAKVAVSPG